MKIEMALNELEWQVFRNTEKVQKLSTKQKTQKIAENCIFCNSKQKNQKKSLFLECFKVKFIIENLRLVQ